MAKALKKYDFDGDWLTVPEAMEKFSSTRSRINTLIRRGQTWRAHVKGHYPMQIESRGVVYSSAAECAKHNNVCVRHVMRYFHGGKEDYIGRINNPNFEQEMLAYRNGEIDKS